MRARLATKSRAVARTNEDRAQFFDAELERKPQRYSAADKPASIGTAA